MSSLDTQQGLAEAQGHRILCMIWLQNPQKLCTVYVHCTPIRLGLIRRFRRDPGPTEAQRP